LISTPGNREIEKHEIGHPEIAGPGKRTRGTMNQEQLSNRLWEFAAQVGRLVDELPDTRLGRHVAGQLVRCGTAAPPSYDESGAAESRADFVHKLSVALKELRESRGWLRFTPRAGLLPRERVAGLVDESEQLCRILGRSVLTAKRRAGTDRSGSDPADGSSAASDS
jgi:four helix bundle protein